MELFCHELVEPDSSFRPVRAFRDAVLTRDSRVCQNLLSSERPSIKPGTEPTDEQRYVRPILTGWMLQVRRDWTNHINPIQWFESCSDSVIRFSWSYAVLWIISTRLSDSNRVLIQWFDSHDLMLSYESYQPDSVIRIMFWFSDSILMI